MDGTLCDFDGALTRDLNKINSPYDPAYLPGPDDSSDPPYILARKAMIKRQPDWWLKLAKFRLGWDVLTIAIKAGYQPHILSKGPFSNADAWRQKHEWCRRELGPTPITLTEDKGLVYGRILVDDWPPYIEAWLAWRKNGTVIMPAHRWNVGYTHPQMIRYDGTNIASVESAILAQYDRNLGE